MEPHVEWKDTLFYPKSYRYVPEREINGAGPKGYGNYVRDTIGKVSIKEAANIHDSYYFLGRTKGIRRKYADQLFLKNMRLIIEKKARNKIHKAYCLSIAQTYYWAVRLFGGHCFKC